MGGVLPPQEQTKANVESVSVWFGELVNYILFGHVKLSTYKLENDPSSVMKSEGLTFKV